MPEGRASRSKTVTRSKCALSTRAASSPLILAPMTMAWWPWKRPGGRTKGFREFRGSKGSGGACTLSLLLLSGQVAVLTADRSRLRGRGWKVRAGALMVSVEERLLAVGGSLLRMSA